MWMNETQCPVSKDCSQQSNKCEQGLTEEFTSKFSFSMERISLSKNNSPSFPGVKEVIFLLAGRTKLEVNIKVL